MYNLSTHEKAIKMLFSIEFYYLFKIGQHWSQTRRIWCTKRSLQFLTLSNCVPLLVKASYYQKLCNRKQL